MQDLPIGGRKHGHLRCTQRDWARSLGKIGEKRPWGDVIWRTRAPSEVRVRAPSTVRGNAYRSRRAVLRRGHDRSRHRSAQQRADRIHHRSEEHTSELQSLMRISYAVFCLKKKKKTTL